MLTPADRGRFRVSDHSELTDRGAFVVGNVVDGVIRPGMRAMTRLEPPTLTIAGVESLDNLGAHRHWNALVFSERPSLEFVTRAFPIGSFIEVEASAVR